MAFSRAVGIAQLAVFATGMAIVFACGDSAGIDATSGSGTTTSAGSGGGSAAFASLSCQALGAEYRRQFELARVCSPELSAGQCTLQVDNELYCPCPRFVNPTNASAVSNLNDVRAGWDAKSCPPAQPECDAGTCSAADGGTNAGTCTPQPEGSSAPGLCQDQP